MDFQKIFIELQKLQNPQKSPKMEAYMKNNFLFLGIQAPQMREFSKKIFANIDKNNIDWKFIFDCFDNNYRESQYLAFYYLRKVKNKLQISDLQNLKKLIQTKSWWDSVDNLFPFVGYIALNNPEINNIMLEWATDENFWIKRVAINHQIWRKNKTNTELLEKIIISNFGSREFFINKVIGWALRDYSKTDKIWVKNFLQKYSEKMSKLSIREASKYI